MGNYVYYNNNPLGLSEEDCVYRAIALALDEDYEEVKEQIRLVAKLYQCDALSSCCYFHLLDDVYKLKRVYGYYGMPIKYFKQFHRKGIYLIRVDGHITTMINGKIYDTWDCTNEKITDIWRVK